MHSLLMLAALVTAQAKPTPIDVTPFKATLQAVTDGQGHFIVFNPAEPLAGQMFSSADGKTFYKTHVIGGGATGTESFNLSFWDPRIGWTRESGNYPSFSMSDSGKNWDLSCGARKTALKPVEGEALAKLLSATFLPPRWTRRPERLLRDDTGTYYFVDRLRTDDDSDRRDFRVFVGPRGKMKQLPLKDIVDDSKGTILATKTGDLRLIASPESRMWIAGPKKLELTDVPVDDNHKMIYTDLGPYAGQPLGTPCDELF